MSNSWGKNIKVTLFGESHGEAIGAIIDGLPVGEDVDIENIRFHMQRRSPGRNMLSSARNENDDFSIMSGIFNGKTQGTPICVIIKNKDVKSKEYTQNLPRPSHADLVANAKYKGYNDYRGGGHFSGRITAGLVFAGSIARDILAKKGIIIASHIKSIYNISEKSFDDYTLTQNIFEKLVQSEFPVLDENVKEKMKNVIIDAKTHENSVGGIIECAAIGLPVGLGEPFFDSLESQIASIIFSIPAVKGIDFGTGFDITNMLGSVANDPIIIENGIFKTKSNNDGGINGGISNGMPIIIKVAIKPTPSIGLEQDTVDIYTKAPTKLKISGRHDPCIVPRAIPVVESAVAIALLDAFLQK